MVRMCAFPGCANKNVSWSPFRFHRIPLRDRDRDCTRRWLAAMNVAADTPRSALRQLRVCSAHFREDDYRGGEPGPRERDRHALTSSAVPHAEVSDATLTESSGNRVNPERTTENQSEQYIVDEEAILQLLRSCPACDRVCRCAKYTRRPYLVVYQNCYFCDYQRKWVNQPEAKDMTIKKTPKRKPKNAASLEDEDESSSSSEEGDEAQTSQPENN